MDKLRIDGVDYELLKAQRGGQRVYRGADRYLRIGAHERIAKDIATHRAMSGMGFPVAAILSSGTLGGEDYFVEQSLGESRFRDLFENDTKQNGEISARHFEQFLHITKLYLEAQLNALVPPSAASFASGVHLDILRQELPHYAISLKDKFERITQKLSGFPYVLTHGDFNPANMYPLGIIDLEDSFSAPFGFDAVSAISTVEWFPDPGDYEFVASYRFTDAQKRSYLAMCDSVSRGVGYPPVSIYYGDFAFCRAIWSLVRMQAWPKLQAWRYEKFIRTYLYN